MHNKVKLTICDYILVLYNISDSKKNIGSSINFIHNFYLNRRKNLSTCNFVLISIINYYSMQKIVASMYIVLLFFLFFYSNSKYFAFNACNITSYLYLIFIFLFCVKYALLFQNFPFDTISHVMHASAKKNFF